MISLRQLAFSITFLATTAVFAQTEQIVLSSESEGPAVLYDDKEISQKELAKMSTDMIGDIQILSGEEAEAKYGKYAEHGVILVTSPAKSQSIQTIITNDLAPGELQESEEQITASLDTGDDAHVVIDGKVSDMATLRALAPERIDKMQVHKGLDAIELFGEVAKGGAIIVTTKQD